MQQHVIGFWKVGNPYGVFSQWYKSKFSDADREYISCEQYMMYQKAILFNDEKMAKLIMKEENQATLKNMGRRVKNFDVRIWDDNKYAIITQGNLFKFTQNKKLSKILLNTKDSILAEASPYDKVYGIGLNPFHPHVQCPSKWKGENLLGKALMEVRSILREEN